MKLMLPKFGFFRVFVDVILFFSSPGIHLQSILNLSASRDFYAALSNLFTPLGTINLNGYFNEGSVKNYPSKFADKYFT